MLNRKLSNKIGKMKQAIFFFVISFFVITLVVLSYNDTYSISGSTKRKIEAKDITFKGLGNYEYPTDDVPDYIRKIHGKRVKIKGFPFPKDNINNTCHFFMMDGSNEFCCSGRTLSLTDFIEVVLKKPIRLNFQHKIIVEGIFLVKPKYDHYGEMYCLYQLVGAEITEETKSSKKKKKKK